MEKIKEFIKKYKSQIIIALGAVSSIVASIALMPNANGALCSIIIAVVAVILGVLKEGLTDATIELIAKAIKIIIEALQKDNTKAVKAKKELTIEDIKNMLKE